jgi:protein-disulfide isomerase
MFCIIAFVVLSILGIFSASNRVLAKEALDCVLRRVTLRPCNTGFDEKMKAKILGVVITRSEGAARFLNKYFEAIAWVFFVLLMASSIFTVRGLYLFYTTGSCNGLNDSAFCVFDPNGANNQVSAVDTKCYVTPPTEKDLNLVGVDTSSFPVIHPDATANKIFFIGCYACDYTRAAYPEIRALADKYADINFIFADYPVKEKTDYLSRVGYCVYKDNPAAYWKMNDDLFATDKANLADTAYVDKLMTGLGLDSAKMNTCIADPQTEKTVQNQFSELKKTKFYGTPTIFIDGDAYVGPKPFRVYAIKLKGLLYFMQ